MGINSKTLCFNLVKFFHLKGHAHPFLNSIYPHEEEEVKREHLHTILPGNKAKLIEEVSFRRFFKIIICQGRA